MNKRNRMRKVVSVILALVIATSLWFASPPLLVQAFDTSISVQDSLLSGQTATTAGLGAGATIPASTYLLGETVSLPASIEFDFQEFKNLSSVQLKLTGPEFSTPFTQALPVTAGTYSYPANATKDSTKPGVLNVTVTWDPGVSYKGYGYGYGYGYVAGLTGNKINYDIKWTPPYSLTVSPTPPPPALPGKTHVFDIPLKPGETTSTMDINSPQDMAYDGTYLYTLVPVPAGTWTFGGISGSFYNVIVKTDTAGNFVDLLPAPGGFWEAEALTCVDSTLYAAYNTWDSTNFVTKGVVKKFSGTSWDSIVGLSNLNPIGGLASDGTNLFVAYRDQLKIDKRNPTTGALITSFDLSQAWGGGMGGGMGGGPPMWGFNALAYGSDLYAAQNETIIKVDPTTGSKTGEYKTGLSDIRGLSFVTETWGGTEYELLYEANRQSPGKVYKSSITGAVPVVENTPVGSYTAEFKVIADSTTYTDTTNFKLDKLTTAPEVSISAPTSGFAKGTDEETITVTGSINDPSVTQVSVGIALPEVTAFADDVENQTQTLAKWQHAAVTGMNQWGPGYSSSDLWHRSNLRAHTGGTSSWRYGVEGTTNFDTTGKGNAAALRTKNKMTVGTDNTLTFWTWYDTEMDFWPDRKLVEVSTNGTTWTPLAWLSQFWPPSTPPDVNPSYFATLTNVPSKAWTQVSISLAAYAGQDVYLRFRFDSMNDWANNGEGWYIDDVNVSGAGFLGKTVDVGADLTFSTEFTLAEGSNTISVSAKRQNYEPIQTGEASVTGSLDTVAPAIALGTVTTPTNLSTQSLTGTITELNFARLTVKVNNVEQYSTTVLTSAGTGVGTFLCTLTLSAGTNNIVVTAMDKVGLTTQGTTSIVYDAVGPVFGAVVGTTQYDIAYKIGEISARPGDWFFICLKVTDAATSVSTVKLVSEGSPSEWPRAIKTSELPVAVIDSWGISTATKAAMNYILPMQLPSGAPAGDYSFTVKAWDTAGNTSTLVVKVKVITALEAFDIYLMPDWNLISSPLMPTNTSMATLTTDIQATGLFERVWYYDASKAGTADEWKLYEPGVSSDLTTIEAGKGYWFKMKDLAAFTTAGKVSEPMKAGLPNTPAPVKLTIAGEVLKAGAVVPPTYTVYAGWNLIGLHSEQSRSVSTALSSVTVPQQTWGSLFQYLNYISFPMREEGQPEIDLGRFDKLISTDTMQPGRGFWLYMMQGGIIVP